MANIIDSYSQSNFDSYFYVHTGYYLGVGQSFTGNGSKLSKSTFYIAKSGSPTGNIVSNIYAHSGTFGTSSVPTGTPLATSNNVDISTITSSMSLVDFTFSGSNNILLTNSTYYVVTIEYSGGDSSNTLLVGRDISAPTANGNLSYYNGSWAFASSDDVCFYVYGGTTNTNSFLQFF